MFPRTFHGDIFVMALSALCRVALRTNKQPHIQAPWKGVKLLLGTGPVIPPDATHGLSFNKDKTLTMINKGSILNFSTNTFCFIFFNDSFILSTVVPAWWLSEVRRLFPLLIFSFRFVVILLNADLKANATFWISRLLRPRRWLNAAPFSTEQTMLDTIFSCAVISTLWLAERVPRL